MEPSQTRLMELLTLLKDHSWTGMERAEEARTELLQYGEAVIQPMLTGMARNEFSYVDVYEAFGDLGEPGIRALAESLQQGPVQLRRHSVEALRCLGAAALSALPALKKALRDDDPEVRRTAATAMAKLGPAAVASLVATLDDVVPEVRASAAHALGLIGPDAKEALPQLLSMAASPRAPGRWGALFALDRVGCLPEESLPIYEKALQDPDETIRHWTMVALGDLRDWSPGALALLIQALDNSDESVRIKAAKSLGRWGRRARSAELKLLKHAVSDLSVNVRDACLDAAWDIGRSARRVIKAMLKRGQAEGGFDVGICNIIEKMGPAAADAVPFLIQALKQDDPDLRWAAVSAIKSIGPDASPAVPLLLECLRDPSGTVAGVAASALASIGPKETIPVLCKALKHPDPRMREYAADALGAIGPPAKGSARMLLKVLTEDAVPEVRGWAAIALGEVAASREAVGSLIASLESPNPVVRQRSAHALGAIGKDAREALPGLQHAVADSFEAVSIAAKEALKKIAGWA